MASVTDPGQVSTRLALGWSTGAVCSSLAINVVGVLLLPFMTSRLGIAAGTAGLIISANKFVGLGFDPLFGYLSDRTRSALGRRRPWLLLGTALIVVSLVMLFRPPEFPTTAVMLVWFGVGMLLFSAGYAAFRVPYLTMSAEMTTSRYVRARLISFKVVAISVGTLLGLSLAPALVDAFGNDRASYGESILVLAVCALASGLTCFASTASARYALRIERPAIGLRAQARSLAANAPLAALVGTKFIVAIGVTFQYSCVAYFVTLVAHQRVAVVSLYFLIGTIVTVASQPFWLRVVRARGKRFTFCVASATYVLGNLGWLAVGASASVSALVVTALIVGLAGGGTQLTTEAMLPDVMSLDEARTGLRREGTIAALFSVAEKLSSGIAIALLGGFLSLAGFVHSTHDVVQPQSARTAIALAISVIPSAAVLVAVCLIFRWGLRDGPGTAVRPLREAAV
jgi:Na+/melibiose symporter-like transporter